MATTPKRVRWLTYSLRHAELGLLGLDFSTLAVDGRPELGMVVYNPVTDDVLLKPLSAGSASNSHIHVKNVPLIGRPALMRH